jgi:carbonic anhydrase
MPSRQSASNTVRLLSTHTYMIGWTHARSHILNCPVLVVGHTHCGGVEACYKAAIGKTPPPNLTTPLGRWLAPLTALAGTLKLHGVPESEALSRILNASVRAQVKNVAGTAPVQKAWADKKKLWVHGLVYDLETGTLKDLNVTIKENEKKP